MIALAEKHRGAHTNIRFQTMDAVNIEYEECTFDAAAAVQSAHHWQDAAGILAEVHRVLQPGARFYLYEADRDLDEVPEGWVARRGMWPPDRVVRLGWRRFGMNRREWTSLRGVAEASPFESIEEDRHGFYRRMVLTR